MVTEPPGSDPVKKGLQLPGATAVRGAAIGTLGKPYSGEVASRKQLQPRRTAWINARRRHRGSPKRPRRTPGPLATRSRTRRRPRPTRPRLATGALVPTVSRSGIVPPAATAVLPTAGPV